MMKALKSPVLWILILALVIGAWIGVFYYRQESQKQVHSAHSNTTHHAMSKPLAQEQSEPPILSRQTPHNIATAEQQTLQAQPKDPTAIQNRMPEDHLAAQEDKNANSHESAILN